MLENSESLDVKARKLRGLELVELSPIQRRMVLIIEQVQGAASARKLLGKFIEHKEKDRCSR